MFWKSFGERSHYLQKYKKLLDIIYDEKGYGIYSYNLYLLFKLKDENKIIRYSSFTVNKLNDNLKY